MSRANCRDPRKLLSDCLKYMQWCGFTPREAWQILHNVCGKNKDIREMSEEECKDAIKRLIVLGLA